MEEVKQRCCKVSAAPRVSQPCSSAAGKFVKFHLLPETQFLLEMGTDKSFSAGVQQLTATSETYFPVPWKYLHKVFLTCEFSLQYGGFPFRFSFSPQRHSFFLVSQPYSLVRLEWRSLSAEFLSVVF